MGTQRHMVAVLPFPMFKVLDLTNLNLPETSTQVLAKFNISLLIGFVSAQIG